MALVESGMLLLPRSVIIFRNQLASTHRVLFAVFIIAVDGDNSEKSPHTIRLRGVYLSRRHQDRANSSPSPHYFTILASPRRYLASISLLASASSLAIFLQIFLPPRKLSRGFSPTFTPSLRLYPRSISNDTSKHQNLSLFLPLSSFLYLSVCLRLEDLQKFLSPNPPTVTRKSKKKRKKKNHTWLELSPLRFFYDDSTNQSPHQEPPTTSPPSPRLTHSNKFLPLFHTLFPFLLLPLLFPFTSHTSLFSAPS